MTFPVKLLSDLAFPPERATPGSAGLDLHAAEAGTIPSGECRTVGIGLALAVPEGHLGLVLGRSGLARQGVACHPGTIDPDYRGELKAILWNHGWAPFHFGLGDRIAQLLILPAPRFEPLVADDLPVTARGVGGFGSTGK